MFKLKSLDHVVLRVDKLRDCIAFYVDVLGCSIENEFDDLGLYQLRAGDFIIDLVDTEGSIGQDGGPAPQRDGHNMDHFCIRIEPFEETSLRRHLVDHGVEASELYSNWGGDGRGPSVYIKDPCGNGIELKGPPTEPYTPNT